MLPIANYTPDGELKVNINPYLEGLSRVRVTKDDSQAISSATATQIQFDDVVYDTLGEFDSATYTFTPINSGYYSVALDIMIGPSTAWSAWTEKTYLATYVNGTLTQFFDRNPHNYSSTSEFVHMEGATTLWLNAGDALTVYVYQASGSSINIYADSRYNVFTINRLPHSMAVVDGIGSLNLIESYVATASVSSITFSDIPSNYRTLMCVLECRSDNASEGDQVNWRANSDTGSNYDYIYVAINSTSDGAGTARATTFGRATQGEAASARASSLSGGVMYFPGYGKIDREKYSYSPGQGRMGDVSADADVYIVHQFSRWRSTSPITSLNFYPNSGANFVIGTTITIYGVS